MFFLFQLASLLSVYSLNHFVCSASRKIQYIFFRATWLLYKCLFPSLSHVIDHNRKCGKRSAIEQWTALYIGGTSAHKQRFEVFFTGDLFFVICLMVDSKCFR